MSCTIVLPWPDRRLSPNARVHWRARVLPKQQARLRTAWTAIASPGFREAQNAAKAREGKIPVTITFFPPDARHRDDDNMIGAFKSHRDGIADALGIDDRRFAPVYVFADPEKPGRIEVVL